MWRKAAIRNRQGSGAGKALRHMLPAALIMLAGPAPAQDWFTAEACRVGEIAIDRRIMPDEAEARWQAEAGQVPNGIGRLWRITAPGGGVSHLWGTYHLPDPAILDLPQAFRDILASAQVVALEFDPTARDRSDLMRGYSQDWMWLPPEIPVDLRRDFPPDVLDHIGLRVETFGWSRDYLPMMRDGAVLSLLLSDPCSDYLAGFLPGQDYYVAQLAYLAGARVTGLQKSWAFGQELSDPVRAEAARAALLAYALYLGPEAVEPGLRETAFALYREGRIAMLDAWSAEWLRFRLGDQRGRKVNALANSYLLVERNAIWMGAARPLLDEGGAVLAVGASHLPGDLGLVEMLRDAGYRLERVLLPGEAG